MPRTAPTCAPKPGSKSHVFRRSSFVTRHCIPALLLAASCTPAFAAVTTATLPADYRILDRKSIFSRDRMTRSPSAEAQRPHPDEKPAPPRVYTPILAGIILEETGTYVAFVADPSSGQMLPFRVGDTLPSNAGTIQAISLDYIETARSADTKPKRILIGQNILGGAAEYASGGSGGGTFSSSGSASSSPSPGSSSPPSSGNVNDIVEQMKRRRMQQLGK